jgi:hypothetical protein
MFFWILCCWLEPPFAVAGTALWALSPLVLHFGTVPMPDVLCTAGVLAAFWNALRNRLWLSSALFAFAVLAKMSVIFFGLPILVALLIERRAWPFWKMLKPSIFWGIIPVVCLAGWLSLELLDSDTPWTIGKLMSSRGGLHKLLTGRYWATVIGCGFPYGLGLLGVVGLSFSFRSSALRKVPIPLTGAIVLASALYLLLVLTKVLEPQYMLPLLAWAAFFSAFGLKELWHWSGSRRRKWGVRGLLLSLHILVAFLFAYDLKSSRVPDFRLVSEAAATMPTGSRVIVSYPFYGAAPAVWLKQNVIAIANLETLQAELPRLQKLGFNHIVLLDVKNRSQNSVKSSIAGFIKSTFRLHHGGQMDKDANISAFARPSSPWFQFCRGKFQLVYQSDYVDVFCLDEVPNDGAQAPGAGNRQ